MFDKIYKLAVMLIAVLLIGLTFYVILTPSNAVSQAAPKITSNYVVPESHAWEAVPNNSNGVGAQSGSWLLINKISGDCYYVSHYNGPEIKKLK